MEKKLQEYEEYLKEQEKSLNTTEKYIRDINKFLIYLKTVSGTMAKKSDITKERCIDYKKMLQKKYESTSVNSMLTALNQFLLYIKKGTCTVNLLKIQKKVFQQEEETLNKEEYQKLVHIASGSGNFRLAMIMETIAGTGIRIGELQYFNVKSVKQGKVMVDNKGKVRTVFIPHKLRVKLLLYIKKNHIQNGCVFVTSQNNPVDRSNVWKEMKKIAEMAKVCITKVFPHNLRHLFAVTYYHCYKDIVKLADILGHSSINTTRIYTITTGKEHEIQMNKLGLVL